MFEKRNSTPALLLIIIFHAAFFLIALNNGNIYLADDSQEYLNQAYNLKHFNNWYGGDFSKPYNAYLQTRRAPLYGFFIFLSKSIYNSDFFVCLVQNLLSVFNFILLLKIAKNLRVKYSPLYIPFALLFFPTQLIYANRIMADVLFQTFVVAAVYFFSGYFESKKPAALFWFVLMITFALLTKPVLYLFWLVIAVFFLMMFRKRIFQVKCVCFALIPAAAVFILSWYNYNKTGYFHFSSGSNMMVYHYYSTASRFTENANALLVSDSLTANARAADNLKELSKRMNNAFINSVKQHPAQFAVLQANGMFQFFIDHGRWDLYSFFVEPVYLQTSGWRQAYNKNGFAGIWNYISKIGWWQFIYLSVTVLINIFLAISLFFFLSDKTINTWTRILTAALIVYLVLFTGMVGCSRYRMAIYPFLLLSIPFAIEKMKHFLMRNHL